jgi:hypothetical protein
VIEPSALVERAKALKGHCVARLCRPPSGEPPHFRGALRSREQRVNMVPTRLRVRPKTFAKDRQREKSGLIFLSFAEIVEWAGQISVRTGAYQNQGGEK